MISLKPQNIIRQIPWRLGSRTALGVVLILMAFSLVGWLYLTQASAVTAASYHIDELRLGLGHINNQNAALILEISELEALSRVEKRALELGFQPANDVQYLSVANYPMPVDSPQETAVLVENSVDAYVDDVEGPNWWVSAVDTVAGWIESR
jgi:hypothetical protein